jgi:propanol-preferring alcohol dehydrogenase
MRALQLVAPGQVEIRDVPIPAPGPEEVLVAVAGAGLCHSDLHVMHAPRTAPVPMTLGHETAGRIAAVGEEVRGFAAGDAVLVHLVWACGTCRACLEGWDNVCMTRAGRAGLPPCPGLGPDGGMAEYMKVAARYLEPLRSLDPVTAGPLADAGLTPMHAVNGARHRLTAGATAVVIGIGGLGHMAVQILKQTTDTRVIAVDTSEQKLGLAERYGADHVLPSDATVVARLLGLTEGYGADAVFDFVGAQPTVDLATHVIAPDGALRFVGVGGGRFTYATGGYGSVLPWGVDVRASYAGTRGDLRQVIELAERNKVSVNATLYELDDGLRAFADLDAGTIPGRAILVPAHADV